MDRFTKQFTAASILLLEERGKLKVDDPVKKYMPDAPAAWDKITIFHLRTHASGIPSFTGFPDYASKEPFSTNARGTGGAISRQAAGFPAGKKMSYSNSGYVLGYPIEKITLETYDKFVQEHQRSAVHVGYNVLAFRICSHGAAKRRLGEYG